MPRPFVIALLALSLFAGCGKKESSSSSSSSPSAASPSSSSPSSAAPAWKHIEGGREHRFAGAVADVPGSWALVPQGNATLLVPPGANQTAIEEIYALMGDPTVKTLDGPELERALDVGVSQLLGVPATRAGDPERRKLGELDGKVWTWKARSMDGRNFEVRAYGFVASYSGSLVAIGTPEALKRRQADIDAIVGSFRRPAAAAITAATLANTWVRAFGSGTALIGNANEQRITFSRDGRFHYHSEGTSHGLFHTGSSQTDVTGSWRLAGDQLSVTADSGESKTFTLEARNEAGTGAAVIAIDGTEFRQAEGRPW